MVSKLILTIGSIIFMMLLMISYTSKDTKITVSVKLYRYLLSTSIALIVTEILEVFLWTYTKNQFIIDLSFRIHYLTGFIYFFVLYYYNMAVISNDKYLTIKEAIIKEKSGLIFLIYTIVVAVVAMLLPVKHMTEETFTFIPGLCAYVSLGYIVLTMIIIAYRVFKIEDASNKTKRAIFFAFFAVVVIGSFQFVFPKMVLFGLGITWGLFIYYFNIENPDLKLIDEIDELKRSVERSSKAKSDFLSNMSHEIRSPMNAIIGFSESIIEDTEFDSTRVLNDINHIKSSSKNLLDIINNILDISKIETGSDTIENREYSLSSHIIDWTGIVETRLENKNIKFMLDVDKEIPSKLYGDSTKIFQVVLNILTNSVKYTEVGRINMTISKQLLNEATMMLKFKVSDTGFGIKEEDYDKVFQKFSRLDSAKTNEIEGTGLGLVLTKKYAELMGGDIWFESEYGAGTTFYFEVPQKIVDPTPMGNILETIDDQLNHALLDCSGKKALIVDDDELNLKVTKRLLGAYKFEVETLNDPEECIYKFKMGEQYDIIFLDHVMKKIDGVELVKVLKSLSGYNVPPIIMLTANAITGVREYYLKSGFDEYLSKPIDINELDKLINMYFNKQ